MNTLKGFFVELRLSIQQVVEDVDYEGQITIADTSFEYKIVFNPNVPTVVRNPGQYLRCEEKERENIAITVKKNSGVVPLTYEEYRIFSQLLVQPVLSFYNNSDTTRRNMEREECCSTGEPFPPPPQQEVDLQANVPYHACLLLEQEKFGCSLIMR